MSNPPKHTVLGWHPQQHTEDATQAQAVPPSQPQAPAGSQMAFAKTMFAENTPPPASPYAQQQAYLAAQSEYAQRDAASGSMQPQHAPPSYSSHDAPRGSSPPPFSQDGAPPSYAQAYPPPSYGAAPQPTAEQQQQLYAQQQAYAQQHGYGQQLAYAQQQLGYGASQPGYGGAQQAYGAAQQGYGGAQPAYGAAQPASAAPQPAFTDPPPYYAPPQAQARVDLAATPQPVAPAGDESKLREQANATSGVSERLRFIRLTYLHLLGAILAFAGLEYLLMTNSMLVEKVSAPFVRFALGGRWNWGVVLAVFMAVSWVADQWASHAKSRAMQYAGLAFYVVAEALIFVPLLAIVAWKTQVILARGGSDPNIIRDSAYVTLAIFGALTASVFITKKDFSFMRSGLMMASGAAMMLIVLSLVFGFNLGLVFSIGMVLLAAGYILFQTSQVLAHYDPRNHVAAALALFSSVALMFWYVIRIFMRARE